MADRVWQRCYLSSPACSRSSFRSGQTFQSSRSTRLRRTKRSIGSATTWPCDYRASTGPPGRSTSSTFGCRDLPRSCRLPSVSRSRNGMPAEGYPCHWSVCRWLAGENAIIERIADLRQAAIALAPFVAALQRIDPTLGRPATHEQLPFGSGESRPAQGACATVWRHQGNVLRPQHKMAGPVILRGDFQHEVRDGVGGGNHIISLAPHAARPHFFPAAVAWPSPLRPKGCSAPVARGKSPRQTWQRWTIETVS